MTTIYQPPGCKKLSELTEQPQMRLGIQGYGGTGKTWTALTFPNPIVANLDRGLGAHTGRADVIEIPFYNDAYCRSIMPNYNTGKLKDLLQIWLSKEGKKLSPEQTLVWDGNTSMQNAYHRWYNDNRVFTSSGKEDDFAQWRLKTQFYADIVEQLKFLPCHVVYIAHEAEKKEKDGSYRGKIRPLLTGQFADELLNHFTSWFRQHASEKPSDLELRYTSPSDISVKLRDVEGEWPTYWVLTEIKFSNKAEGRILTIDTKTIYKLSAVPLSLNWNF